MSKKKRKRPALSGELDLSEVDEALLLDSNWFYWNVIRPDEEAAEELRKKRAERRAARKASQEAAAQPKPTPTVTEPAPDENGLLIAIDAIIRTTHHAYGYRHLGELGQQLRERYPDLDWSKYGCKKLIDFLQKYPEIFRIKWSAPAHKGAGHVWVRLAKEPKRKEGYAG
jgi:hypothetical protein